MPLSCRRAAPFAHSRRSPGSGRHPLGNVRRAEVRAAEGRLCQAGARANPELSVEVENFLGTGDFAGVRGVETTVAVNQRLDLGGRRGARSAVARAELAEAQLRLAIARGDLPTGARAICARRDGPRPTPPCRRCRGARSRTCSHRRPVGRCGTRSAASRVRARSAAAQAAARLETARAEERAARASLAVLFGVVTPPESLTGPLIGLDRAP